MSAAGFRPQAVLGKGECRGGIPLCRGSQGVSPCYLEAFLGWAGGKKNAHVAATTPTPPIAHNTSPERQTTPTPLSPR